MENKILLNYYELAVKNMDKKKYDKAEKYAKMVIENENNYEVEGLYLLKRIYQIKNNQRGVDMCNDLIYKKNFYLVGSGLSAVTFS